MKFPLNLKPFGFVHIPLIIVSIPVGLPSQDTKALVSSSECGAEWGGGWAVAKRCRFPVVTVIQGILLT
ncbi:hypothetical protein Pan258_31690 [Symmachiella dynata]|nr:hypothetical protein Pan258_31690 [Symmachiella dynata]